MGGPVKRRAPAKICPYVNEGSRRPQRGIAPRCTQRHQQKKKRGEESSPRPGKVSLGLSRPLAPEYSQTNQARSEQ